MKKSITIKIPEPCHEDWAQMTPTEKGKFCGVCTKEVFDFTKSTDEELIKRLDAGKSLCGRFSKSQLDREVKMERKSKNNLLPYAASLLLPLSILGTSEMNAQGGPIVHENAFVSLGIGGNPVKSIVTITGFITDINNIPINNAEVFVLETGKSVRTAPDGSYKLVCTSGSTIFSIKDGLTSERIIVGTKDATVDMKLKEERIFKTVLAGMIVTEEVPNSCEEPLDGEIIETIEGEIEVIDPQPDTSDVSNSEEKTLAELLQGKVGKFIVDESEQPDEVLKVMISGTVSDLRGPIPGVRVQVKGMEVQTETDFDGNYTLGVDPNTTLIFSYLGYVSKEILVSNINNTIDVTLDEDIQGEIEVMVLGRMQLVPNPPKKNKKIRSRKKKK